MKKIKSTLLLGLVGISLFTAFIISGTAYAATVTVAPYDGGSAALKEEALETSGFPYPEKRKYVKVTATPAIPNSTSVGFTTTNNCFFFDDGMGGGLHGQSYTRTAYAGNVTVGIAATQDTVYEGTHSCKVTATLTSADPEFNGASGQLTYTITDDDPAPASTTTPKTTTSQPNTTTAAETAATAQPEKPTLDSLKVGESVVSATDKFQLKTSETIIFKGKTIPNGIVTLTVYSEPKSFTGTADQDGNYEIPVSGLPEGDHHAEVTVKDPVSGLSSEAAKIAEFSVLASTASGQSAESVRAKAGLSLPVILGIIGLLGLGTAAVVIALKRKQAANKKQDDTTTSEEAPKDNTAAQ